MTSFENATVEQNLYTRLMSAADPRVGEYFLMQNPMPISLICAFYIYFVLKAGPEWMKNRQPYNLRPILIAYNAAQTIFSTWLFYEGLVFWVENYGLSCVRLEHTDLSPKAQWGIRMCYLYFLSKISELADTVFFVLKKKQQHVSLLHVFHHAIMPISVWFGMKFFPGGNFAFFGLVNLFVHIWMYLYYMMAAMGPQYQKYVWWKRHITQLQLAQFGAVLSYMIYIFYKCNINRVLIFWTIILDIIFVYLFTDFYIKAYKRKGAADKAAATEKVLAELQNQRKVQ